MDKKANEIIVFITASTEEEAAKIGRALVEARLAACVNIIPQIRSIYRWQGKIEDDTEVLMLAKTRSDKFGALAKKVQEMHSYDVPEVIAVPIQHGAKDYLNWINQETERS